MKKITIIALMLALAVNVFASDPQGDRSVNKHWTVNPNLYANNMTMVGVITLNGDALLNESYEVGAFSGDECRGSEVLKYYAAVDKYLLYLTVYGEDNDIISFRLYNHQEGYELVEATAADVTFVVNAMHGLPSSPYLFEFTCPLHDVACQPNIAAAGTVDGSGSYFLGQPCTVSATANTGYHFLRWTDNGTAVSTQTNYTFNVEGTHQMVAEFAYAVTDTIAQSCVTFDWHGNTYNASGVYHDTMISTVGIDSLVDLHLTIRPDYHIDLNATECGVYYWDEEPFYQSGDYQRAHQSVYGCDSIETLHLTIIPIRPLGDFGYMSPVNNFVVRYTDRELYWDVVPNATRYDLYFWQGDGGKPNTPKASNLTSTNYHVYGLNHAGVYHWCVVAKNECVESESPTRTFTCQLDPSMTVIPTGMMNFGDVSLGQSRTKSISVSSVALSEPITYSYLDNDWGQDAAYFAVTPVSWDAASGGRLNVTFTPEPTQLYYQSAIRIASGVFADTIYFMGSVADRYVYTTEVDSDVFSANDTIDIHGHVDDILGHPVQGKAVTVYMTVMGSRITMPAVSDLNGDYTVHYIPAYSESGYYQVGSCASGDYTTVVHDAFDIPGMGRVNNDFIIWNPYQNDTVSGVFEIRNRSRIPISGIQVNYQALPSGCVVDISGVTELGPLQTGQLHYTVTGNVVSTGNSYIEVPIVLTSNEGVSMNMTCYYYCRKRIGSLDVYPPSVATTMRRNEQKTLSFQVTNRGNGETGPITVSLPNVEWMSLVGNATMESLQPGDSCAFSVMLSPNANVSLNQYNGSIAVNCANGSGTSVPYRIEAVADTTNTLIVDVTDDFTYNTNNGFGPHLAGANVKLTGYYSLQTVAQGMTDENGLFTMENLPEGYYYLSITADSHKSYNTIVLLDGSQPTRESLHEVYLQYQAVTYSWVVVPTQIEDEYEFELVCDVQTNVPVPVVTIQAPSAFDPLEYGDTIHFNMTVRNDGLVDALDVQINMPTEFSEYKFSSLYDFIDTLHANTTVTVPCALTRVQGGGRDADDCVEGSTKLRHFYYCNFQKKWVEFFHPIHITTHCYQTSPPNTINHHHLAYEYGFLDWPTGTSGTYYPGGSSNGGSGGSGPSGPDEGGTTAVAPGSTVDPIIIPTEGDCTPCWKVISSKLVNMVGSVTGIPVGSLWDCAINTFNFYEEFSFGKLATRSWQFAKCVIDNCLQEAVSELSVTVKIYSVITNIIDFADQIHECFRVEDEPIDRDSPQMYVLVEQLEQIASALESTKGLMDNLFGDEAWLDEPNLEDFMDNFFTLVDTNSYMLSSQALEQLIQVSELSNVSTEQIEAFAERWNRSVQYWDAGYHSASDLPEGYNADFIQEVSGLMEQLEDAQEATTVSYGYDDMTEMLNSTLNNITALTREHDNDVCAKITIQFNQTMTMTREAFEGTLKIHNGHTFAPMQDINVDIVIKNDAGVDCTDLFQVDVKSLSQLTGVDGTGTLDAQTEGTVVFEMIPTIEAAPATSTFYSFGGSLTFLDPFSDLEVTYPLFPVRLQVNPSPNLHVDYFVSRHIISDDPLTTDTIEATEPAEIAMMIRNVGAGDANNVYLQSAQPQIIDNQQGLLIQFNMVSSAMNGVPRPLGLTDIPFGTIQSNTAGIAEWYFTSTLLARVLNSTPRVIHNNSRGNPKLSLVTELHSHELIKAVNAYGALDDGINDFLVNETPDVGHLPDMVYFSHGGTAQVNPMLAASIEGELTYNNREVQLVVTPYSEGWNYTCVDDPAEGEYDIVSCTRNDGTEIPLSNVWITWVTMPDEGAPIHENKLHLLDTLPTGQQASYTIVYEPSKISLQTITLAEGVNWWSSYIDLTDTGLSAIEEGLAGNGVIIGSQRNGFVTYDDGDWYGNLNALDNRQMYRIRTNAETVLLMTGARLNASQLTIETMPGWNWIGYPLSTAQPVAAALANLQPANEDVLKSQTQFAMYDSEDGWFGVLGEMEPGLGYMYMGSQAHSFQYHVGNAKAGEAVGELFWKADVHAYTDNMSVVAVVMLDGVEQRSGQLEAGAFSEGRPVGGARLLYNAKRDRWYAMLPVSGSGGEEVSFRLYDAETGEEYGIEADEHIAFTANAVAGTLDHPMVLNFRTVTSVDEAAEAVLRLYPNPTPKGGEVRLSLPADEKARVEVYNLLNVLVCVKEISGNTLDLGNTLASGTYLLKVSTEKGQIYHGKLIVK